MFRACPERRNQSTENKEIRQNKSARTALPDEYWGYNFGTLILALLFSAFVPRPVCFCTKHNSWSYKDASIAAQKRLLRCQIRRASAATSAGCCGRRNRRIRHRSRNCGTAVEIAKLRNCSTAVKNCGAVYCGISTAAPQ